MFVTFISFLHAVGWAQLDVVQVRALSPLLIALRLLKPQIILIELVEKRKIAQKYNLI